MVVQVGGAGCVGSRHTHRDRGHQNGEDDGVAKGEWRGIVVGDVVRRLVARTMAQQLAPQVESATAPFQYALSTGAGSENPDSHCDVH